MGLQVDLGVNRMLQEVFPGCFYIMLRPVVVGSKARDEVVQDIVRTPIPSLTLSRGIRNPYPVPPHPKLSYVGYTIMPAV